MENNYNISKGNSFNPLLGNELEEQPIYEELPTEIYQIIFSHLSDKDLSAAAAVCWRWNAESLGAAISRKLNPICDFAFELKEFMDDDLHADKIARILELIAIVDNEKFSSLKEVETFEIEFREGLSEIIESLPEDTIDGFFDTFKGKQKNQIYFDFCVLSEKYNKLQNDLDEQLNYKEGFSPDEVRLLISKGASPRIYHLEKTVRFDDISTAEILIDAGVCPTSDSLTYAMQNFRSHEFIMLLIDAGAPLTAKSFSMALERWPSKEIIDLFLDSKVVLMRDHLEKCIKYNRGGQLLSTIIEAGVKPEYGDLEKILFVTIENSGMNSSPSQRKLDMLKVVLIAGLNPTETLMKRVFDKQVVFKEEIEALILAIPEVSKDLLNYVLDKGAVRSLWIMLLEKSVDIPSDCLHRILMRWSCDETWKIDCINYLVNSGHHLSNEMFYEPLKKGFDQDVLETLLSTGFIPSTDVLNHALTSCKEYGADSKKDSIIQLIEAGVKPDDTSLDHAIETFYSYDLVEIILKNGLIPKPSHLLKAISKLGFEDTFPLLLEAIPELPDNFILELINAGGTPEYIQALQDRGLKLPKTISIASLNKNVHGETLTFLIDSGILDKNEALDFVVEFTNRRFRRKLTLSLLNHGVVPTINTIELAIKKGSIDTKEMILLLKACKSLTLDMMHEILSAGKLNDEVFEMFIKSGVKPNQSTLELAIQNRSIETKKILQLLKACEILTLDMMHEILSAGKLNDEIFEMFIEDGVKPNESTLDLAIIQGELKIIEVILDQGTIPTISHLKQAATNKMAQSSKEIFGIILDASPEIYEEILEDIVFWAAPETIEALVERGANLSDGILDKCCLSDIRIESINSLLKVGAKPTEFTLEIAINFCFFNRIPVTEVIKLLIEAGAVPSEKSVLLAKEYSSNYVLSGACQISKKDVLLLSNARK